MINTRDIIGKAFIKSVPIMCSYVFVGMAYGIMMEAAGLPWYLSLIISVVVYTGAFQFVLISFLTGGVSLITIAVSALLMNSRQVFYSISYVDEFKGMGKKLPFMIHTMTDETYAVNCTILEKGEYKQKQMFFIALFSWLYWMAGTVLGGLIGQLIPYDMEGIDFCMTALFVVIFIEQWEKTDKHIAAVTGILVAVICLFIFGASNFILPALLVTSCILVLYGRKERISNG